jgi:hypothetical protein
MRTQMKKRYKIKLSKKQLETIKQCWKVFKKEEEYFYKAISRIEERMSKETGIEGMEFFICDGDWCGIGNADRTLKLIQREELEK